MANIFKDNPYLEKGQSIQPNLDAFTKNSFTTGVTSVATTPTTANQQAISAENIINPQVPAQLPKQPVNNMDFSGILASLKTLSENLGKVEQPKQENNLEMLFKQYLGEQTAPESMSDMYQQSYDQSGIKAKQDLVNSLNSQLNAITSSSQVAQQQLESQASGKDITTSFLGRQQQEVGRQAAIKALPIAAQLASAQGDLTSAQSHLDTLFQIKSQDAQNQYNYKQKLIDSVYSFATKAEQAKLDEKAKQNEQEFTLMRDQASREHDIAMQKLEQQSPEYQLKLENQRLQNQKLQKELAGGFDEVDVGASIQSLAQAQSNITSVSDLLKSGGISGAVGTSFLSRTPVSKGGFWSGLGTVVANIVKAPLTLGIGTAKDIYSTKMTSQRQDFIAGVEQLSSQLSLDSLIKAKAQGATFGALSDTEMQILTQSATKIGNWAIKDNQGRTIGYNTTQKSFKIELDKINNFAKLDYLLKGGNPEDVGVVQQEDGTYWTQNSDGSYTQLQ